MPAVDRWFAKDGTFFSRAYTTTPVCCPARASIMTGRYAHNTGVRRNPEALLLDQDSTIQRYLDDSGYQTAVVGKFLNTWPTTQDPPNFDRWAVFESGYQDVLGNVDGDIRPLPGYSTRFVTDHSMELLQDFEAVDDDPWFLYLAPYAPHEPFTTEPEYSAADFGLWPGNRAVRERNRKDKPSYVRKSHVRLPRGRQLRTMQLRTLLSVDDLVDEVFEALRDLGELEQTMAVFLSDNGFMWGEHGLKGKNVPYAPSVRVPMYLRWPGRAPDGQTDGSLVANIDLAPTIMEAAGIQPDPQYPVDGRSLLGGDRGRLLLEMFGGPGPWASMITTSLQYVEYYRDDGVRVRFRELYRLGRDPSQLENVLADGDRRNDPPKHRLRFLRAQLRADRACAGTAGFSPCP
jgi:arylsulfatase A-like enzyme